MTINENKLKYFSIISSVFTAVLLISNTVGIKIFTLYNFNVSGGIIVFPVAYIFGDVLTEVYGYRASRKIIWTGLLCLILMSIVYYVVQLLPPAPFWENQKSYEAVLGLVPRITIASITAYFFGEFINSYVLAKMKVIYKGRHLWARTIGSTVIGEGVDTIVFCFIAFTGIFNTRQILGVVASNYIIKVFYEIISTPITYIIVGFLKKEEGIDVYDFNTNFNPFILDRFTHEK